jgi:hypothetical protein
LPSSGRKARSTPARARSEDSERRWPQGTPVARRRRRPRSRHRTACRRASRRAHRSASVRLFLVPDLVIVKLVGGLDRVLSSEDPDQATVGGRDRRGRQVVRHHESGHLHDGNVRAERAGARTHDPLDRLAVIPVELRLTEQAEDDSFVVHDDARVPPCCSDAFADLTHRLVESTRRDVTASHGPSSRTLGVRALGGKARREPVQLSVHVIMDYREAERFEPPRGSWAEVSGRIPAVDDDRPVGIEPPLRLGFDLAER